MIHTPLDTWTAFWSLVLALVLVWMIVWGIDGWWVNRLHRQANSEALERLWSHTCPDCGASREFIKDGRRMLAPPHDGRCVRPYDYDQDGL